MNATQVWTNGNIFTMEALNPRVSAIVARNGEIAFAGDDGAALAFAGPEAVVRDLEGKTVVPGFNDNHVHAIFMADHTLAPDLAGLDESEIVALLSRLFPAPRRGEIIRAYNWDYPACPRPRKEILDAVFPRNPVILSQFSGHAQWLNGTALRALGIRKGSRDPSAGCVLRDADGEPTGIVRDLRNTHFSKKRNRDAYWSRPQRERRVTIALETFAALGITSVQDNAWYWPELWSLKARWRKGTLSARFSAWSLGRDAKNRRLMDACFAIGAGEADWVRPGPVKYFIDGTFSSRNACLFEPFIDTREQTALCMDGQTIREALRFLAGHERQGAFHIIGDRGVAVFLDAFETMLEEYPVLRNLRIRIEHAQLVRPADIRRIAELGILVAVQPTSLATPEKDVALLGAERASTAYPYRSFLDAGVHLSFGSDIPGESGCDPIRSIHLAANREGSERITAAEALFCHTAGSAYAEFMEQRKGKLVPGMLADFAVLSHDITAIDTSRIKTVTVEETVVGGKTVYRKKPVQ